MKDPTDEQIAETLRMLEGFRRSETPSSENEASQLDRLITLVSTVAKGEK